MDMDYSRLYRLATQNRAAFGQGSPFPHAVLDGFLNPEAYAEVRRLFPPPGSPIWKCPENRHTRSKMVTRRGTDDLKEALLGAEARQMFHEFNSSLFLRFLETLTGIGGLIGDPYLAEGGFHCIGDGGYLDAHADFSHHDRLGLERRLNLLLYLNDGWRPEFGGELSLYDADGNAMQKIMPAGNRCVIFATSETSFHGHPDPMRLPAGVFRRSMALYYYSAPTGRPRKPISFLTDPAFVHTATSE